jgi:hypothetical protein
MPVANYSTTVSVTRTLMEVQGMLARAGAQSVLIDYRDGEPFALSFLLAIHGEPVSFRLPANADAMLQVLSRDPKVPRSKRTPEHAHRVAWRVVRDWLRAQLALVEAEQATLAEAMLPYAVTPTGQTLYEALEERGPGLLRLEAPVEDEHE